MLKSGFIIINKPTGISSFGVVARIRKILNVKKVGHCGTLDPEATGVLVVAINQATKIIEYLVSDNKTYDVTMKLGITSDTYDIWGQIKETVGFSINALSDEQVVTAIKSFIGDYEQLPPIYSAIKINGKRLYKYARANEQVVIKPRPVTISTITNINKVASDEWNFNCQVSKGTYIRSLVHDIGNVLNGGAVMNKLSRIKSGKFMINQAKFLEEINWNSLLSIVDAWSGPVVKLTNLEEIKKLKNGLTINLKFTGKIALAIVDGLAFAILEKGVDNSIKVHKGLWAN